MNKNISLQPAQVWKTCGYVRLSHEDGDKEESDSVTGQKELIRDFLSRHPEMIECGMKVDDGHTGSHFRRPAFQEMMHEVKAGKINCIVVKDLSRFGRNYLDAGEYIERIFPFLGVRFIAIHDGYDSLYRNAETDALIIPLKNLINEAYCRDSSMKIRSQLEIKRRRGDFIGAFPAYGYLKDPENKNHLIVDDFAAGVVRDIFHWKMQGISAGDIAGRLNHHGVLPPLEYKKSLGMHFTSPFRRNKKSLWNVTTVLRILKNPIYTGVLEQGKNTTPSYKVKRRIKKPCEEWAIVEGMHEAIIDRGDFAIIQKVLAQDTRTSPGNTAVALFSGMVFCGECGAAMVRKTVPSEHKKYVYYVCAAHKTEKTCYAHSLRDGALEEIVLESIKNQIQGEFDLGEIRKLIETVMLQMSNVKKQKARLGKKHEEISRYQKLLCSLYENLADGMIDRKEYQKLKETYSTLLKEAEKQAENLQGEMNLFLENGEEKQHWIEQFKKHRSITKLDRAVVASFIERILIYRDKRVEIVYSWQDKLAWLAGIPSKMQDASDDHGREVR